MAMDNPYVTPCGHIFSKLGLYALLKKKQVIECPRLGCRGKNVRKSTIKPAEINLDLELDQEEDGRRRCYNTCQIAQMVLNHRYVTTSGGAASFEHMYL